MRHFESAVSLLGLAITILAWIVPQDRIGYDVKFALLGAGLMAIGLGVVLLVRGWHGRGKQRAVDQLSEAMSQAIHELINKPRPDASSHPRPQRERTTAAPWFSPFRYVESGGEAIKVEPPRPMSTDR